MTSPAPANAPEGPKTTPVVTPQAELAQRVLSKRRLIPFTQRINPRYDAGWVHHDIARRLERFSDDVAKGLSPRLMILMPPRHGKQLADSTRVPTPAGWTTHGELRPGAQVFGPDGAPCTVLAVSPKTASDMLVTFTDGSQVRCHENHEWSVYCRPQGSWQVMSTKTLASRTLMSGSRASYQLPTAAPLEFPGAGLLPAQRRVGFKSIEYAPNGESGHCIHVDRDDGLYVVGGENSLIVTHNSELASRMFPAWHLGRHPDHEIIACSYNVSLAMSFSRKVKEVMNDPGYHSVFEARLHPDFQANEEWGLAANRGGYVAAGVGGGITGKGAHVLLIDDPCVAEGTLVRTARGHVPIQHVVVGDLVLTHRGRWRAVMAVYDNGVKDVVELEAGAYKITLTPEHLIYTSGGWVEAQRAKDVYGEDLPAVQRDVPGAFAHPEVLQRRVPRHESAHSAQGVPGLRGRVSAEERRSTGVLRRGVPACAPHGTQTPHMPALRGRVPRPCQHSQVLQSGVSQGERENSCGPQAGELRGVGTPAARPAPTPSQGTVAAALHALRHHLFAIAYVSAVLWGRLQECRPQRPYERADQLELPAWAGCRLLRPRVQAANQQGGPGKVPRVHAVRVEDLPGGAPPRRGQDQQRNTEPGLPVRLVPHPVSQVRVAGRARVYDLTVEDDHSFVAAGVVVHNCKNAEEADSADYREKLWDWYGSTAYTRLAPGGGVLAIQTCWHDDDLAGRLQMAMATDPDADQFEIVKYPAIAEEDEYLNLETDLLEHGAAPDADHRLLRLKGEPLHPERYDLLKLNRIRKTIPTRFWSALYQQNPTPEDGAYFTKSQFRTNPLPAIQRCNVFIAFDFAISEKKQNDYTVGVVGLQDSDDVIHVAEILRFKSGDGMFVVDSIVNLCKKWYSPGMILGVEDGQIYRAIDTMLRKRMRERQVYVPIQALKPITDKLARARPLQGRMQQGMVSFAEGAGWYDTARTEMLRFPAGVHDDQVDALAWMAMMAVDRQPPRKQTAKGLKSWKDKLNTGSAGSAMTA